MKTLLILGASLMTLAACAPSVPDSGQGVGFTDYADYQLDQARRDAALRGDPAPTISPNGAILPPSAASTVPSVGGAALPSTNQAVSPATDGVSTNDLAAAGINTGGTPPVVTDNPSASAVAPLGSNPEISDEQNFGAVSARRGIESDAERRTRQAAAYELIEATALPDRSGNAGPNIVQYALQAPNNRGESVFNRAGLSGEGRFQRNCAKYPTPDDAQRDFLGRGGPSRDRLGLDPDGDGFACGWDPQAFRALATGN